MRVLGSACALLAMTVCVASDRVASTPERGSVDPVQQGQRVSLPPLGRILVAEPVSAPVVMKAEATLRVPARRPVVSVKTVQAKAKKPAKVTRISGYVYCGSSVKSAQRCIDAGKLTLYRPAGVRTLAGHNYLGWYWMDDLPVGRKVVIGSGALAGTYRVYAHGWAKRGSQGGRFPSAGLGASVALQTCTSNGTGFSFLRRISNG